MTIGFYDSYTPDLSYRLLRNRPWNSFKVVLRPKQSRHRSSVNSSLWPEFSPYFFDYANEFDNSHQNLVGHYALPMALTHYDAWHDMVDGTLLDTMLSKAGYKRRLPPSILCDRKETSALKKLKDDNDLKEVGKKKKPSKIRAINALTCEESELAKFLINFYDLSEIKQKTSSDTSENTQLKSSTDLAVTLAVGEDRLTDNVHTPAPMTTSSVDQETKAPQNRPTIPNVPTKPIPPTSTTILPRPLVKVFGASYDNVNGWRYYSKGFGDEDEDDGKVALIKATQPQSNETLAFSSAAMAKEKEASNNTQECSESSSSVTTTCLEPMMLPKPSECLLQTRQSTDHNDASPIDQTDHNPDAIEIPLRSIPCNISEVSVEDVDDEESIILQPSADAPESDSVCEPVQTLADLCELWRHELSVLSAMGFSDAVTLIPLLQEHIGSPRKPSCEVQRGLQRIFTVLIKSEPTS